MYCDFVFRNFLATQCILYGFFWVFHPKVFSSYKVYHTKVFRDCELATHKSYIYLRSYVLPPTGCDFNINIYIV